MATRKKKLVSMRDSLDVAREELHAVFAAQVKQLDVLFDPKELQARLLDILVKERREIIFKVMGLSNHFGRLEVNSKSPLWDHLNTHAKAAADRFMTEMLVPMFDDRAQNLLTRPEVMKALNEEFDRVFRYQLSQHARTLAEKAARDAMAKMQTELLESLKLAPNANV